jgi:RimJ/RimL family protein N-acetyltransferase
LTRFEPVSAVVPVYAGAATLRELHRRLNAVLTTACSDHEIVFVEDAGPDDAWRVIEALSREDGRVRGLRLARNVGQHNALLCGVREARFGVVVTLDDDLQHPPDAISALLDALEPGVDVVYGSPSEGVHSPLRNLASKLFKRLVSRALAAPHAAGISAFRAFRTSLRDDFADHHGPTESLDALLARATGRFASVRVRHAPRRSGRSGYDAARLVRQAALVWAGFGDGRAGRWARRLAGAGQSGQALYEVAARAGSPGDPAGLSPSPEVRGAPEFGPDAVTLRPLVLTDAHRMFGWMQDPTVSRNIGLTRKPSLEYSEHWIQSASGDRDRWARAIVSRGEHVGNVVLDLIDRSVGSARISIYLGERAARGLGIGDLAMRAALEAGFGTLALSRIWLTVYTANRPAMQLYERLGFQADRYASPEEAMGETAGAIRMSLARESFSLARPPSVSGQVRPESRTA